MHRKHDRDPERGHALERSEHRREPLGIVRVLGTVDGREGEIALLDPQVPDDPCTFLGRRQIPGQHVEHHVSHLMDALFDPLLQEVRDRRVRRTEQKGAEVVGENTIDLLRHVALVRTETRLHVRHRYAQLRRRERPRQRAVGVPHHEHDIGPIAHDDALDPFEHPAGLSAVRSGTDAELVVGERQVELAEEHIRQTGIVVLPRVQQSGLDLKRAVVVRPRALERAEDRGYLHELRARPDDRQHGQPFLCHHLAPRWRIRPTRPRPAPARAEARRRAQDRARARTHRS